MFTVFKRGLVHNWLGVSISSVWCLGIQPLAGYSVSLLQSGAFSSFLKEPGKGFSWECRKALGVKDRLTAVLEAGGC